MIVTAEVITDSVMSSNFLNTLYVYISVAVIPCLNNVVYVTIVE